MARVVFAANSTWNLENFRGGLIRALARQGHDIITISPDPHGVQFAGTSMRHHQCDMVRSGTNPLQDLSYLLRLLRILRDEKPDVLFGFTIKPNIYGCLACQILGVQAVPNVSGLGTAFLGSPLRQAVLLMYRIALKRANPVFFQNPDDERYFVRERVVRTGQSRVLPGSGVNLDHFSLEELPTTLTFLMIGRLLGDKGVREYAAAARSLKKTKPHSKFLLLGGLDAENRSAISRAELDTWIAEGTIEYLGSTSDVRPYIATCAAVVLPSYREGLPRSLLEAAAMGRPMIATNVPGCREIVREGETGFLCEPRDPPSLTAALERFCSMPRHEQLAMGARARALVEQKYGEHLVIRAYLDALAEK